MTNAPLVITAAGQISALGNGFGALKEELLQPQTPVDLGPFEFHAFDRVPRGYKAGTYNPEAVLGKKGLRTKDWATKLLLGTFEIDLKEAIALRTAAGECPGFSIGTMFGSVGSIGDFLSDSLVNGVNAVNPQAFANTVINAPTGNANIRYENRTLSATIANGFGSSFAALIYAIDYLNNGYAQSVIAGGFDEISYYTLLGLALSGLSSNDPMTPFAQLPHGFTIGEGSALFLIESAERAAAHQAPVLATIAGIAGGFEPPNATTRLPAGDGLARAIAEACKQAAIKPSDIDWIAGNANGSSLDAIEAGVLHATVPNAAITSYKNRIGECMGGSQALTLACAITDLNEQRISGCPDGYPLCAGLDFVFETRAKQAQHVLVTMLTCEGHCGALIIKHK